MIKKLQRKFMLSAMASLLIVFLVLIIGINSVSLYRVNQALNHKLILIAENEGRFPEFIPADKPDKPDITKETKYETRYFVVTGDQSEKEQEFYLENIATVTNEDASAYLKEVLESGKTFGYCDTYKYYVANADEQDYMVVFLYCYDDLQLLKAMLFITVGVGILCLLAVFVLVTVFSKKAMRPVAESLEHQKQFITDASHEIKTPLGILAANNDVLAIEHGDNEWLESSRHQIERLAGLVNNMVTLSRLDEEQPIPEPEDFSVSDAVLDVAANFEGPARMQGKKIAFDVEPNIKFCGDEMAVRQLTAIFLDNGVKYSTDGGTIGVRLHRKRKTIFLEVSNACDNLETANLNRLFDRFYRADSARSDKSGYGIGLSIAKGIAETRGYKISVYSDDGSAIKFTVAL